MKQTALLLFILALTANLANAQSCPAMQIELHYTVGAVSNIGSPVQPPSYNRVALAGYTRKTYYGVSEEMDFPAQQFGIMFSPLSTASNRISLRLGVQYIRFNSIVRADSSVEVTHQSYPIQNAYTSKNVVKGYVWKVEQAQLQIPVLCRFNFLNKPQHRLFVEGGMLFNSYNTGKYPAGFDAEADDDELTRRIKLGLQAGAGYTFAFDMNKAKLLMSAGITAVHQFNSKTSMQQHQFVGLRIAAGVEWCR
ncbi:MAG: PorT family protein [Bacteroidia bacterium]|nr:PorT family protein [Bacteroidia bacterium]